MCPLTDSTISIFSRRSTAWRTWKCSLPGSADAVLGNEDEEVAAQFNRHKKQTNEEFVNKENWRVPNPPGANPLVAERAGGRSSQSCVTEGQQTVGNPYRFLSFLLHTRQPLSDPNSHLLGSLSFSYQGVSTREVRHAPGEDVIEATEITTASTLFSVIDGSKLQLQLHHPISFNVLECNCNGLSSISGWTNVEFINRKCNFNYSTQTLAELILQKWMSG